MSAYTSRLVAARDSLTRTSDVSARLDLLLFLSDFLASSDADAALDYASEALTLADQSGDTGRGAEARLALIFPLIVQAECDKALVQINTVTALQLYDQRIAARLHLARAQHAHAVLDLPRALSHLDKSQMICSKEQFMDLLGEVLLYRAMVEMDHQLYTTAFDHLRRAQQLIREHERFHLIPWVHFGFYHLLSSLDFLTSANSCLQVGMEAAKELGDGNAVASFHWAVALTAARQGDLNRTLSELDAAENSLKPRDRLISLRVLIERGRTLVKRRELQAAQDVFELALKRSADYGQNIRHLIISADLGSLLLQRGQYAAAYEYLYSAKRGLPDGRGLPRVQARIAHLLAECAEIRGDLSIAVTNYREYVGLLKRHMAELVPASTAIAGRLEEPEKARLAAVAESERSKLIEIEAEYQAKLTERERELEHNAIQFEQHAALFELLEEEIHEQHALSDDAIRGIEKALHDRPTKEALGSFENRSKWLDPEFQRKIATICPNLTSAELRLCVLSRLGYSPKEIANGFFISPRTIDSHRLRIRRKLGLSRATQLDVYLRSL